MPPFATMAAPPAAPPRWLRPWWRPRASSWSSPLAGPGRGGWAVGIPKPCPGPSRRSHPGRTAPSVPGLHRLSVHLRPPFRAEEGPLPSRRPWTEPPEPPVDAALAVDPPRVVSVGRGELVRSPAGSRPRPAPEPPGADGLDPVHAVNANSSAHCMREATSLARAVLNRWEAELSGRRTMRVPTRLIAATVLAGLLARLRGAAGRSCSGPLSTQRANARDQLQGHRQLHRAAQAGGDRAYLREHQRQGRGARYGASVEAMLVTFFKRRASSWLWSVRKSPRSSRRRSSCRRARSRTEGTIRRRGSCWRGSMSSCWAP